VSIDNFLLFAATGADMGQKRVEAAELDEHFTHLAVITSNPCPYLQHK
jgi:hypothetical protein